MGIYILSLYISGHTSHIMHFTPTVSVCVCVCVYIYIYTHTHAEYLRKDKWNMMIYEIMNLTLWLSKHHVIQTYWGVEVWLYAFLTAALDESGRSASCWDHVTIRKEGGLKSVQWLGYRMYGREIKVWILAVARINHLYRLWYSSSLQLTGCLRQSSRDRRVITHLHLVWI
jgi:hypothetical protein